MVSWVRIPRRAHRCRDADTSASEKAGPLAEGWSRALPEASMLLNFRVVTSAGEQGGTTLAMMAGAAMTRGD